MFNQLKTGFASYLEAQKFITSNRLRVYYLVPLVLTIFIWTIGLSWAGSLTDWLSTYFIDLIGIEKDAEYTTIFADIIWWFVFLVVKIMSIFIVNFIGGGLILLIMSPVLAHLSEKTDQILNGKDYPFSIAQLLKDAFRGVVISLRNTTIQTVILILLLGFSFVPVLGWIGPVLSFLVSAYFYGFSFMDYTCERKKMKMGESIQFIKKNKGLAVANGTIFSLVLMIPFIGSSLAGFIAITSVVAATISINKLNG